jgi:predicted dehydrogenase
MEKAIKGFAPRAKATMDYRKLLADPNVDVVCISTPDHWHGIQGLDALMAGKDVYCEKPITHWRQFETAKQLAWAVRDSDRVFQVGTQGMYDSAWHQMRKYVQEGMIGPPIHAECGYFRTGEMGERGMAIDDPNAKPGPDLDWDAFLGDSPKRPFDVSRFFRWRMYEDYAGGPATDLYPHSLTPVLYILDLKMPSTVTATGGKFRYMEREVPDTFNVLIDYPEKVTIVVSGTLGNDNQGTGLRGTGMKIPIIRGWDGSLTIQGNEIVCIPTPPGLSWDEKPAKPPKRFPIEHGEDFVEYWRSFLKCCRSRERRTLCPMDLAYYAQTPLVMAYAGWREGKTARFDATAERIVLS